VILRRGRLAAAVSTAAVLLSACAQSNRTCPLQPVAPSFTLPEGCNVQWEGQQGGAYFTCDDGRVGFVG